MASYYTHNYDVFGREVLRAPFMRSAMRARAAAIMGQAQSLAQEHIDTGDYVSSFELSDGLTTIGGEGIRVYARVTNTAGHASSVEYGFGNVPRYRTLGKAMFAAGGDVKGTL